MVYFAIKCYFSQVELLYLSLTLHPGLYLFSCSTLGLQRNNKNNNRELQRHSLPQTLGVLILTPQVMQRAVGPLSLLYHPILRWFVEKTMIPYHLFIIKTSSHQKVIIIRAEGSISLPQELIRLKYLYLLSMLVYMLDTRLDMDKPCTSVAFRLSHCQND